MGVKHKHAFGENLFKLSIFFLDQDFVWYSLLGQLLENIIVAEANLPESAGGQYCDG